MFIMYYQKNMPKGCKVKNHLKLLLGFTISLSTISFLPAPEIIRPVYAENKKVSLAIIDFDNNSDNKDWDYMEKGVPRILITNLAQNKGLKVVERAKLDRAIKELNFSQTGLVSPDTAKKLGKLIGADYALFGSITRFGTNRPTIIIDVTIIEIQTGEIKYVESVRGTDENNIINLLDKLSEMVIADLVVPDNVPPVAVVNKNVSTPVSIPAPVIDQPLPTPINKPVQETPKINMNDKLVFTGLSETKEQNIYIKSSGGNSNKVSTIKGHNSSPIWSPDGTKIAYVNKKFGVTIFDVKQNSTIKLSEKPVFDESPRWSAEGSRIVFLTKESKNYAIYSSDMNGNNANAISPVKVDVKDFDISKYNIIAYSAKVDKKWQIFLIDINGNGIKQLTEEGNNVSPKWSPDGTKLTFISDRTDYQKVYTMNSNSSNQIKITSGEYDEESPVWSPDGTKIAFVSLVNKKGKVSIVDTNGTNQKILTNDEDGDYYDIKWLHNQDEIAFTSKGNLYLVKTDGSIKSMINLDINDVQEPDWKR